MLSTLNNSYLSLDQDTNQFLMSIGIEFQIFYLIIKNFMN